MTKEQAINTLKEEAVGARQLSLEGDSDAQQQYHNGRRAGLERAIALVKNIER